MARWATSAAGRCTASQPARIGQGRRASWLLARCAHGGATAGSTSILRILEDTLPGPRPEESVRSAISPGFPAVPVTLPPERRLEGPLRPFWRPLRAFRRRFEDPPPTIR